MYSRCLTMTQHPLKIYTNVTVLIFLSEFEQLPQKIHIFGKIDKKFMSQE